MGLACMASPSLVQHSQIQAETRTCYISTPISEGLQGAGHDPVHRIVADDKIRKLDKRKRCI